MLITLVICALIAFKGAHGRTADITLKELDNPTVAYPENPLIFKQIGIMFPTLSYAHLRTTLDIDDLNLAVNQTCMYRDSLKILRNYNIGYIANPELSSEMKQEVQDANSSLSYPTEGFIFFMDDRLTQLEYRCQQATDTAQLLKNIFIPRAATMSSQQLHYKWVERFAMAIAVGISLLSSLFNFAENLRLSSQHDQIEENIKHIITDVNRLKTITNRLAAGYTQISTELRQIKSTQTIALLEQTCVNIAVIALQKATEQVDYIQLIERGIYDAIAGRLAPHLVTPIDLHRALKTLISAALAK